MLIGIEHVIKIRFPCLACQAVRHHAKPRVRHTIIVKASEELVPHFLHGFNRHHKATRHDGLQHGHGVQTDIGAAIYCNRTGLQDGAVERCQVRFKIEPGAAIEFPNAPVKVLQLLM